MILLCVSCPESEMRSEKNCKTFIFWPFICGYFWTWHLKYTKVIFLRRTSVKTNYSSSLEFDDELMTKSDLLIKMSYFDFFITSFTTSGKMIIFLLKLLKRHSCILGYVFMFLTQSNQVD